jgi:hypothetical protein
MALLFPLSVEVFADRLFLESATFTPQRSDETTGLGSLDPLHAQLASPLWRVDCSTGPIENDDAEGLAALIELLQQPGHDFYICNPRKLAPRMDPDGSLLLGTTVLHPSAPWNDSFTWSNLIYWDAVTSEFIPVIDSVAGNNHQITISGLPAGYILGPGDMFAFKYGPIEQQRTALHRFADTGLANSSGVISNIEVFPHIRAGAEAGDVVILLEPAMLAKMIPGTYKPQGRGGEHESFSFSALQKLY